MIQAKEREKSSRHGPITNDDRHDRHEGPRIADSTSQLTDGDGLPRHIRAAHRGNVLLLVHDADAHAVQRGGDCGCPCDRDRSFHSGTGVRNFDGPARYMDLRISMRTSLLRCLCGWPCLRQRGMISSGAPARPVKTSAGWLRGPGWLSSLLRRARDMPPVRARRPRRPCWRRWSRPTGRSRQDGCADPLKPVSPGGRTW